jgi:N-acetyl sugar amidotransferase
MKSLYNLPKKIIFCTKCVMSNQRPSSIPEFFHDKKRTRAKYLNIVDGVCDACRFSQIKKNINWRLREKELLKLLDRHRSSNRSYDCIVPGSGGKDSVYAAHVLKYKYGMNPLTITWPPILYTDYGYENFKNWIEVGGFDNITFKPSGKVMKILTKLAIENLLHPFQTFILGQKNIAPKIAKKFNIPLVFYGESESEYGNPVAETNVSLRNKNYYASKNLNKILLAGCSLKHLNKKFNLSLKDLDIFLPLEHSSLKNFNLQVHYLGYYMKWIPQEAYYYSVENVGFKPRPFRTEGTYSKYNSIDDKIDDLHYYTTFIKFGIGRATYDSSQEIRNSHLTREEAKILVKRFDGEKPTKYLQEILDYIGLNRDRFFKICDAFRSPHIWKKVGNKFRLRHTVNMDGLDD